MYLLEFQALLIHVRIHVQFLRTQILAIFYAFYNFYW